MIDGKKMEIYAEPIELKENETALIFDEKGMRLIIQEHEYANWGEAVATAIHVLHIEQDRILGAVLKTKIDELFNVEK